MNGSGPRARVEVYQQPDGYWRWHWTQRADEAETTLVSFRTFDSPSEAEESARKAYPETAVKVHRQRRRRRHRARSALRAAAVMVLVARRLRADR
ncbi:hypothetical protein ACWDWO_23290 [Actinopolymorpha singaporensis]|uniref:Uncharacterized protein n=1 Tax=Actinopolymorpha singaporensis TaxID=117157 RepID=A0A1H1TJF3_9ACTN|nr:hypothetical protein [Actinopolymorpha singaporensis]SDS60338.1 hypothetical protein SAMN04489717_3225 [Actinopolymorpha singaporensis]